MPNGLSDERMQQTRDLRRELFSVLSWRTEARASGLTVERGQRVRNRVGHLMRWTRAHNSLPPIPGRAAILCFHGVIAHRPDPDVECEHLPLGGFRKLLDVLDRSFHVISLAELVDSLRAGRNPPPKSIVITFDDGYANNCDVAAEELQRRRMPWSAFLPAALIESGTYQWIDEVRLLVHRGRARKVRLPNGPSLLELELNTPSARHEAVRAIHKLCRYVPDELRKNRLSALYESYPVGELQELRSRYRSFAPMTWVQAAQLAASGVDVGSHSLTHTALGPQSAEDIRREVFAARELLQKRIGPHSPHFSYPYGRAESLSPISEAVLAEAGYNCALTLEQDVVRCSQANLLQLPRLIVSPLVGRMVFNLWQRFLR